MKILLSHKNYWLLVAILLCFTGCKKEEETATPQGNLAQAPTNYNQVFEFEVTVEQNKVVEVLQKTGTSQVARRTYRYTTDTIFETYFEFQKMRSLHKHRIDGDLVTVTVDSVYGTDTVDYFQETFYSYQEGGEMDKKVVNKYSITPDSASKSTMEYSYFYSDENLKRVEYESLSSSDTLPCTDEYVPTSLTAEYDLFNLLGTEEGSKSRNLKASYKRGVNCAGNGKDGALQMEYWYEIDNKERITAIVYTRTFNGTTETFRENYTYILR